MTADVVAVRDGSALAALDQNLPATAAALVSDTVARWSTDIDNCARLAARLVYTDMVPASYWPLPPGTKLAQVTDQNPRVPIGDESEESYRRRTEVAVATTAGTFYTAALLGISWNTALQGIDYVRGRQSMRSELMASLFLAAGHELDVVEQGAERCLIRARRRGGEWREFEFTIGRAITAGYVKGKGPNAGGYRGNDLYNTDPATMLRARCTSITVKTLAPEVIRGIPTVEEVRDEPAPVDVTVTSSRPVTSDDLAPRTGRSALEEVTLRREAAASSRLDGETHAVDEPAPPAEDTSMIDAATWARINARLNEIGVSGQGKTADRLRVVARIIDRKIEQGRELTAREAGRVLDQLAGAAGPILCADVLDRPDLRPAEEHLPPAEEEPGEPGPVVNHGGVLTDDDVALPDPTAGGDPWAGQ